jgi:hypothetical protein
MNTTAIANGMDGGLEEPDWPPLTLDEVRALLSGFPGCGEPIRDSDGKSAAVFRGQRGAAGGRRVFIKRHHRSVRDREGLLEEHRFLEPSSCPRSAGAARFCGFIG